MRMNLLRYTALALMISTVSAGVSACGFHTSQTIAKTMLNLHYPDALHVDGAVWSAQQAGLLPLDLKRFQATGSERKILDARAYHETQKALYALGASFEQVSPQVARPGVSVVLTQTMLWTHYPAGGGTKPHLSGPEPGDLVVVSDAPVVRTIADGGLRVTEAMEKGLIRLYGTSEQQRAFMNSYGELGAKPLPAVDGRKLLKALLWNQ